MAAEYLYLYPGSHGEAVQQHEEELWERSFRENVCCARAIEKAIRQGAQGKDHIPADCAASVLEEYGHKRVGFVLAHTVYEENRIVYEGHIISDGAKKWAKGFPQYTDDGYGRYFEVDTALSLLEEFIGQVRTEFAKYDLFDREHCSAGVYDENVTGKVLVLSTKALKEGCWSQENQLWLANGGFGCDPKASGRAIYATCLGDGEQARWNREDFIGVLDEQYLPDWAKEKMEVLRAPKQDAAPEQGGLTMG